MTELNTRIGRVAPRQTDSSPAERRSAPGSLLRDVEGTMILRAEEGDIKFKVKVVNISGGGAAILAEEAPRAGQPLRLTLPSKPDQQPIEGQVIETRCDPSGGWLVHVRFARWVPLGPFLEAHRDRRLWERYPVRESRSRVTWREGAAEKSICGDLLNICVGGAAFRGEVLPPSGTPIWLALEAGDQQGVRINAVEGRVLMSSFDPSGKRVAHIQFVDLCPSDFLNLAIRGPG